MYQRGLWMLMMMSVSWQQPMHVVVGAISETPLCSSEVKEWIAGVPIENIFYLGGRNIAAEIYNKEYANAIICGAEKWRKPLAKFLRQPHFTVFDISKSNFSSLNLGQQADFNIR
ncbi:hypothetical protein Bca4012_028651 [Brassica carinata]